MNHDIDAATVPCERLIDRVIHQFEHHMVQPGTVIRIADIHTGPFAHGVQALEDLDIG